MYLVLVNQSKFIIFQFWLTSYLFIEESGLTQEVRGGLQSQIVTPTVQIFQGLFMLDFLTSRIEVIHSMKIKQCSVSFHTFVRHSLQAKYVHA